MLYLVALASDSCPTANEAAAQETRRCAYGVHAVPATFLSLRFPSLHPKTETQLSSACGSADLTPALVE